MKYINPIAASSAGFASSTFPKTKGALQINPAIPIPVRFQGKPLWKSFSRSDDLGLISRPPGTGVQVQKKLTEEGSSLRRDDYGVMFKS